MRSPDGRRIVAVAFSESRSERPGLFKVSCGYVRWITSRINQVCPPLFAQSCCGNCCAPRLGFSGGRIIVAVSFCESRLVGWDFQQLLLYFMLSHLTSIVVPGNYDFRV